MSEKGDSRVRPAVPDGALKLKAVRRLTLTGWVAGIVIATALMLPAPPTEQLGAWGWAIGGGIQLLSASAWFVFRRMGDRVGFRALLLVTWILPVDIAAMQWLAGGWDAPYHELFLPALILGAAGLPPRRFLPFAAAIAFLAMLPALYAPERVGLVGMTTELAVWGLVVGTLSFVTTRIRGHARLARVDQLTGLSNRRALEERFDARATGAMTLGVGDLDGFKDINDRHGHLAGDAALAAVGQVLAEHARDDDLVFRWGGDEFAVLLPGTTGEDARSVFARLEEAVSEQVRDPAGNPVEITFGWTEADADADLRAVIDAADQVLLARKAQAREARRHHRRRQRAMRTVAADRRSRDDAPTTNR